MDTSTQREGAGRVVNRRRGQQSPSPVNNFRGDAVVDLAMWAHRDLPAGRGSPQSRLQAPRIARTPDQGEAKGGGRQGAQAAPRERVGGRGAIADGAPTLTRHIAHSDGLIYWRDADPCEIPEEPTRGGRGNRGGDPATDAETLAEAARGRAYKLGDLRAYSTELLRTGRGRRAFDHLLQNPAAFHLTVARAAWRAAAFIGTAPEATAAARAWDASKGEAL